MHRRRVEPSCCAFGRLWIWLHPERAGDLAGWLQERLDAQQRAVAEVQDRLGEEEEREEKAAAAQRSAAERQAKAARSAREERAERKRRVRVAAAAVWHPRRK